MVNVVDLAALVVVVSSGPFVAVNVVAFVPKLEVPDVFVVECEDDIPDRRTDTETYDKSFHRLLYAVEPFLQLVYSFIGNAVTIIFTINVIYTSLLQM